MTNKKVEMLDIFCGAGGLAQGFKKIGFQITGVDISESAGKTFQLNNKSPFIQADLSKELMKGNYDIIIGGPPCKPWSSVNVTRRGKSHRDYDLLSRYFLHIEYHLPKVFLLENVPPLAKDDDFLKHIKELYKHGYSVKSKVIAYSDYGASTSRHRLIVFGTKGGDAGEFFDKLTQHRQPSRTVKDAIWKLRNTKKYEEKDHVWPELKTIHKYREYYETGKFGWYVLNWNRPAPSFGNVMKTYILHPDAFNGRSARVISVREALLIMGFDWDFDFPQGLGLGTKYQLIVDAVSPVFSLAAAKVIKGIFHKEGSLPDEAAN